MTNTKIRNHIAVCSTIHVVGLRVTIQKTIQVSHHVSNYAVTFSFGPFFFSLARSLSLSPCFHFPLPTSLQRAPLSLLQLQVVLMSYGNSLSSYQYGTFGSTMCHEVSGQDYVESIDALARAVTTLKKQVAESGGEENPSGDFKHVYTR